MSILEVITDQLEYSTDHNGELLYLAEVRVGGDQADPDQWMRAEDVFLLFKDYFRHLKYNFEPGTDRGDFEGRSDVFGLLTDITDQLIAGVIVDDQFQG